MSLYNTFKFGIRVAIPLILINLLYFCKKEEKVSNKDIQLVHLSNDSCLWGIWEGEYSGYDPNLKQNETIRRRLSVFADTLYTDTIWGKPTSASEYIIYQCEKGKWVTIDDGSVMQWTPKESQRMEISNGGKLTLWDREPHVDQLLMNADRTQWAFKDTELDPDVDYFLKSNR
jgi:hypothetical protein